MKKDQRGFGAVEAILILVVVILLGASAWFLWHRSQSDGSDANNTSNNQAADQVATDDLQNKEKDKKAVSLTEYKNDEFGFKFSYPSTWEKDVSESYTERGANEGSIVVTSPAGARISFVYTLGGKGGGCQEDPADVPHSTYGNCSTLEILGREQLPTATPQGDSVAMYNVRFTPARSASTYGLYLESKDREPDDDVNVGAWFNMGQVSGKQGPSTIEVRVSGGDQSSPDYFTSTQGKEAAEVLRSFRLY